MGAIGFTKQVLLVLKITLTFQGYCLTDVYWKLRGRGDYNIQVSVGPHEDDFYLSNCCCNLSTVVSWSNVIAGSSGYQATLVWKGRRGPPSYQITEEQLSFLRTCRFSVKEIAALLQVSVRTVHRRLRFVTSMLIF